MRYVLIFKLRTILKFGAKMAHYSTKGKRLVAALLEKYPEKQMSAEEIFVALGTEAPGQSSVYRILSAGVLVMFGAMASLDVVWSIGDVFMALLTACNLIAIVALSRYAFKLLDDYRRQKRSGIKDPVFHAKEYPELSNDIDLDIWK